MVERIYGSEFVTRPPVANNDTTPKLLIPGDNYYHLATEM